MLHNNNTTDSLFHYVAHRPHKHEVYFQNIIQFYGICINVILCILIRKVWPSLLTFLWNSQVNSIVCCTKHQPNQTVNEKSTGIYVQSVLSFHWFSQNSQPFIKFLCTSPVPNFIPLRHHKYKLGKTSFMALNKVWAWVSLH